MVERAKRNKLAWGVGAVAVALATFFVFRAVAALVAIAMWWGLCLMTGNVVETHKEGDYDRYLAFWVLGCLFQLLVAIPVVGSILLIWEPVIVLGLYAGGELVLRKGFEVLSRLRKVTPSAGH